MKAKARLLKIEHVSGTSKAQKPYDMQVGQFLDLETFDKIRLVLPENDVKALADACGKDGWLDVGLDARTEKLYFHGFKVAA